ncbi:hypothetical protein ACQCT5_02545 [Sutcliffiella halmapala]
MKKQIRSIPIEVLSLKDQKEYYVSSATVKKLKSENGPHYINLVERRATVQNEQNLGLFTWPSTELSGAGIDSETNGLNQKSALIKLGYQKTDTTKEHRWAALERAVPLIGLKKVAYTIAGNIKLRKGQKNGFTKYRYAISEWESDLSKLK